MGTLTQKYNASYNSQQSQGVYSRSIINAKGKLITAMPSSHPTMLDRNYSGDNMGNRSKNSEDLRMIIGDRKKIESAGPSYIEINATAAMVQHQLEQAIANPNTPMGQYVASIFKELSAQGSEKLNRMAMQQGARDAPGMQNPADPQAELAQLDLSMPIRRPVQMMPDAMAFSQMRLPNDADRYAQYGGEASVFDPNVPQAWYFADPNGPKRARLGGVTVGDKVFVGDRVENQLRHKPINVPPPRHTQPYTTLPNAATGNNAPNEMMYEAAYGPNPSSYN